jgi:hypothetical protein
MADAKNTTTAAMGTPAPAVSVQRDDGAPADDGFAPIIVDLGKQRRRRVKRLRKGRGPLLDVVRDTMEELKGSGQLGDRPVVFICRQKRGGGGGRRRGLFPW